MAKDKLTNKQQLFIDEYLKDFNAAAAARRAGYSVKTAREQGYDLLRLPHISSQIQARLDEVHMGADEALKLTADIARGDLGDFLAIGKMGFSIDLDEAREAQKTGLLKKVKQQTVTINGKQEDKEIHTIEIELYDRQAALRDILKLHGRFTEKMDVTSGGDKIGITDDERLARLLVLVKKANESK